MIVCAYFHPTTTELDICYLYFAKNFKYTKHLQGSKTPVAKMSRPINAPLRVKLWLEVPKNSVRDNITAKSPSCEKSVSVHSFFNFKESNLKTQAKN